MQWNFVFEKLFHLTKDIFIFILRCALSRHEFYVMTHFTALFFACPNHLISPTVFPISTDDADDLNEDKQQILNAHDV